MKKILKVSRKRKTEMGNYKEAGTRTASDMSTATYAVEDNDTIS